MTAEGWNGKSLRQHIESAGADAAAARELAESAHDELANLRAEMAELAERLGKAGEARSHVGQA